MFGSFLRLSLNPPKIETTSSSTFHSEGMISVDPPKIAVISSVFSPSASLEPYKLISDPPKI